MEVCDLATNNKSAIPDLKRKDRTLTADDKEKAELLNEQFTSIYTEEDLLNIPEVEPLPVLSNLDDITISKKEVQKLPPYKQKLWCRQGPSIPSEQLAEHMCVYSQVPNIREGT